MEVTLNAIIFVAIVIILGAVFLGLQDQIAKQTPSRVSSKSNQQSKKDSRKKNRNNATESNTNDANKKPEEKKQKKKEKVKTLPIQEKQLDDSDRELITLAKEALVVPQKTVVQENKKQQPAKQSQEANKKSGGKQQQQQQPQAQQQEESGEDWSTVKKGDTDALKKRVSELEEELRASKKLAEKYNGLLKDQKEKSNKSIKEKKNLEVEVANLKKLVARGGNSKVDENSLNYTQKPKVNQQTEKQEVSAEVKFYFFKMLILVNVVRE